MQKRRLFILSFLGGANIALLSFFFTAFFPDKYHPAIFIVSLIIMWVIGAERAMHGVSVAFLSAMMIGLYFGFVLTSSATVSIQNMRFSVDIAWFLISLIALPVGAVILQLPLLFFGSRVFSPVAQFSFLAILILLVIAVKGNLVSFIYRVKAPNLDYDLAAGKVIIYPNPVIANAKYSHEYSIQNKGPSTIPSETFEVEFYIDGHLANFDRRTSEMRPGQTIFCYGKSDANLSVGAHSYRLVVDPDHRLKETNEGNNIQEGSFLVVSKK